MAHEGEAVPSSGPLLSAADIFQLASLEARARLIAEGVWLGGHKSRRFGSSTEFAEHKLYAPGDEIKHLDWRTYARTDRYFVRRYEEETNLDLYLVLDVSGSMAYAGGARGAFGISKLRYGATLMAAYAWLALRRSDAVSLTLFAGGEEAHIPPRARSDQLGVILHALEHADARGRTAPDEVLGALAARISRRSLIVLCSDLLDAGEAPLSALGVLRKRGCDVQVLHLLDPDELEFTFDGVVRFEDLEGDRQIQVDAPGVREAYLAELARFLEDIRHACATRDLRYLPLRSDQSPVEAMRLAVASARWQRGG